MKASQFPVRVLSFTAFILPAIVASALPPPMVWSYKAGDQCFAHSTGFPKGDAWQVVVGMPSNAMMTFGPYTREIPRGFTQVTFDLSIDDNGAKSGDNSLVLSLDVTSHNGQQFLASRDVYRRDFDTSGQEQPFVLDIYNPADSPLEFRVLWRGAAAVTHYDTRVTSFSLTSKELVFPASDPRNSHEVGSQELSGWRTWDNQPADKLLTYGPRTAELPAGPAQALFTLKIADNSSDDTDIVTLNVTTDDAQTVLASRVIRRTEFDEAKRFQDFGVKFYNPGRPLEFRVYWHGGTAVWHLKTTVFPVPDSKCDANAVGCEMPLAGVSNPITDANGLIQDTMASLMRDAELTVVRETVYWRLAIDSNGRLDPSSRMIRSMDEHVPFYPANSLIQEWVVHDDPGIYSFSNRHLAYQSLAQFMFDLVTRYPDVRYWELFNEMDGGWTSLFGDGRGVSQLDSGRMYAEMLDVVVPYIRAANPQARILLGGLAIPNVQFIRGIYDGGGAPNFDIANFHMYGIPIAPRIAVDAGSIRSVLDNMGDSYKQIWVTETGISAADQLLASVCVDQLKNLGPCLDSNKAAQIEDTLGTWYEMAQSDRRIDVLLFYCLNAGGGGSVPFQLQGLLPRDRSPDDYGYGLMRTGNVTPGVGYGSVRRALIKARRLEPSESAAIPVGPLKIPPRSEATQ